MLTKTIWRVEPQWTKDNPKGHSYNRGAKTYSDFGHAMSAYRYFVGRGLDVRLLQAEVTQSDWREVTPQV
jgi:hypothetical protein